MNGRSALNHAVLVVGNLSEPHLFHWSYRANAFVEGAFGPPPLYCRPRHNYFDSLDQSAEHDDRAIFIAYGGRRFLIPRAYQPRPTWPGMHMLLTAKAPDFEPTNGRMQEGNLATMISIDFESTSMLESWRDRPTDSDKIEALGTVYGLTKERITRSYSHDPGLQYYQLRSDGTVATLISAYLRHLSSNASTFSNRTDCCCSSTRCHRTFRNGSRCRRTCALCWIRLWSRMRRDSERRKHVRSRPMSATGAKTDLSWSPHACPNRDCRNNV